jgi:hypothetical protein
MQNVSTELYTPVGHATLNLMVDSPGCIVT